MIGGLVQQQNVGRLHQRLDNRQPLLPASGQACRFRFQVFESRPAQCLRKAGAALRLWHGGTRRSASSTTERTVSPGLNCESCST